MKEGMDPVVIAFIRGMVIVGEVACAVKGKAAPDLISLLGKSSAISQNISGQWAAANPWVNLKPEL